MPFFVAKIKFGARFLGNLGGEGGGTQSVTEEDKKDSSVGMLACLLTSVLATCCVTHDAFLKISFSFAHRIMSLVCS